MFSSRRVDGSHYAQYLNLDVLLDLQSPRSSAEDPWVHGDEHLFIVVHQCSELLLRQVLVDLNEAAAVMGSSSSGHDLRRCDDNLRRAGELLNLLGASMTALHSMRVGSFAAFRPLLGSASGVQSAQFHELRQVLGMAGTGKSVLFDAFEKLLAANGFEISEIFRSVDSDHIVRRVAESMLNLSEAVWQCLNQHVRLVAWTLGDARGTAGSRGVTYLEKRVAAPFDELWQARSVPFAEGA
ncbi:tryptophan 2,3-dioxygenase family protein [Lentzea sp. E54]|uniref:tryptophan 2,3-dioxygenase family protein n=1 Tax=Lentzea xerophila TaxID=3435883 RepID=UPI003DA4CC6E